MRKAKHPVRLGILAVVAATMAVGLVWTYGLAPAWRTRAAALKATVPANGHATFTVKPAIDAAAKWTEQREPPPSGKNAVKPRTAVPLSKPMDAHAAGLVGRLFLALDADHDGRLQSAEIPEKYRAAAIAAAKDRPAGLSFAEFVVALERLPIDQNAEQVHPAKTSTFGARGEVPVYRPKATKDQKLPAWFSERDKDGDNQVSLSEWPAEAIDQFRKLDQNGDGFLTPDEIRAR